MGSINATLRPAIGLSANAMNRNKRWAPAPRTCIIPELFAFCEQNDILLTRAVSSDRRDWFFVPGSSIASVVQADYVIPSVLFLPDRATRNIQLDIMQRVCAANFVGGAL